MNASPATPELSGSESPAPSGDAEKQLQFNDQTNYIPPRKIITVFSHIPPPPIFPPL